MRAEEGDETIEDLADEAKKARETIKEAAGTDGETADAEADELGDATPGPR